MITKYIVNAPCEIVSMQLGIPQEYKEQLIQESYRLKSRKDRENHNSFKDVFDEKEKQVIASSYHVWEESILFNSLLDNILEIVKNNSIRNEQGYVITGAWIGIYNKDQIAKKHIHDPNYKSFVYYISAEEPYTPMVFNDVGIEIDTITDRLIVFPSNIIHSVPPSKGGERIMIAGNVQGIL